MAAILVMLLQNILILIRLFSLAKENLSKYARIFYYVFLSVTHILENTLSKETQEMFQLSLNLSRV